MAYLSIIKKSVGFAKISFDGFLASTALQTPQFAI